MRKSIFSKPEINLFKLQNVFVHKSSFKFQNTAHVRQLSQKQNHSLEVQNFCKNSVDTNFILFLQKKAVLVISTVSVLYPLSIQEEIEHMAGGNFG